MSRSSSIPSPTGTKNSPTATSESKFRPVYKSRGATRVGNHWEVFSLKLGRIVNLYSDLEYDHWLLVESDPNVITFCEQPCYVSAVINGVLHRSVPDMWILHKDGREELVEVKYLKDVPNQHSKSQIKTQGEYAKRENISHRIITDKEIRSNRIKLENVAKMLHAIKNGKKESETNNDRIEVNQIHDMISKHGGIMKIGEILKATTSFKSHETCSKIYEAILSGEITAPFEEMRITKETPLSLLTKKA